MLYNIKVLILIKYNMETATIIVIFVSSLLLELLHILFIQRLDQLLKNLRDPFEEHEDKKINQFIYLFFNHSRCLKKYKF
jgi:hypothetical protein